MFPISFYIGLILIGIFAGFASGLLGVGGGFLMVPLQFFLFNSVGVDPSLAMMVSLGTSLAIIIPTASSGAYQHQKKNKSIVKPAIRLAIFGIIGGFCGGLLANVVPSRILQVIFACLLFIVALDMLFGSRTDGEKAECCYCRFFNRDCLWIAWCRWWSVPDSSTLHIVWIQLDSSYWNIFSFYCIDSYWRADFLYLHWLVS